ncbi:MAG: hypothetical protein JW876_06655 [Candidatus Krumholzibacteriota bacterium]|nr:hypothetical protein [Candidatus Krumholzibacteriota bacterium]
MASTGLFLFAFALSYFFTGGMLRWSLRRRLLDVPNDRSSHTVPRPRLGGAAIVAASLVGIAVLVVAGRRPFGLAGVTAGVLGGGLLIAVVGLVDDLRGLDARVKLVAQIAAATICVLTGTVLGELRLPLVGAFSLGVFAAPVTIVWIVGLVNFYNFIDGIDGLAAGVGMIASIFLAVILSFAGAPALGAVYAIVAGSCFGFLRYNFPPARIFMGDTGSTFIGFFFAVLAVAGEGSGTPLFITVLLLGGVLGDAALTLGRRLLQHERIFTPHRTHYYQRFTSLGLSHKQVTLIEYLFAGLLGVSALFYLRGETVFVTVFSILWSGFFLWALVKVRSMERGNRPFWEGRILAIAVGDVFFVAVSYVLSYYLRLNFRFPEAETGSMLASLPIVVVIRTAVFAWYGLYRSVWRYTTFDDLMRVVKAVSIGSAVMIVSFTLLFRFEAFPRSVFIIDWFILTVFLAGSRIATRWFHELPAHEDIGARRVVIGGTGHIAEAILHRVKKSGGMRPVGFLDDRTGMHGRTIHGIEVLGSLAEVDRLAADGRIEEIILTASLLDRFPPERRARLEEAGVAVRIVSDPDEIDGPAPPGRRPGAGGPVTVMLEEIRRRIDAGDDEGAVAAAVRLAALAEREKDA